MSSSGQKIKSTSRQRVKRETICQFHSIVPGHSPTAPFSLKFRKSHCIPFLSNLRTCSCADWTYLTGAHKKHGPGTQINAFLPHRLNIHHSGTFVDSGKLRHELRNN